MILIFIVDGGYAPGVVMVVESPVFDLTRMRYPAVSFDVWHDTRAAADGMLVQYTQNRGVNWYALGCYDCGVPGAYTTRAVAALTAFVNEPNRVLPGYAGASLNGTAGTGWLRHTYRLGLDPVSGVSGASRYVPCQLETAFRLVFAAAGAYDASAAARVAHRGAMVANFRVHEAAVHPADVCTLE
eukprot:CAMPEP_0198325668 /NCGR_PEP_ID=MMETSP1450-20131203/13366_1 /TAXON_ID=753684 ORGANISM="Madagascaria erythrocladiodes, Strain CCMP3234" /NCGR_SAMPLE_ID=MMETSP1450 /ASSEMBLY_ACC=CAM_ASM_001115 /LENGTH=184 /DNA_ID=CAMNT_0044029583 /DNA_START=1 /DNA_END=552 /DNA_ORIENTATION=+